MHPTRSTKGFFHLTGDPLKVVAAAVSPVVMVSATAILISGVNSRYISVSDRVRNLAHEYRNDPVSAARRVNIQRQIRIFHRRLRLVSSATQVLYAAVACFIVVALLISVSVLNSMIEVVTLPLFLIGLALIAFAITLQLVELRESNATIELESSDILNDAEK